MGAPQQDKALDLYRAAARQNHPEAQYNLAVMLLERDSESEEAYLLLQEAAKMGVVEAQEVLLVDGCGDTKEKRSDNVDKMLGEVEEDGGEQQLRARGRSGYRHCPCSKRLPHWVIGEQQRGSENFQSALGHHCTEQQYCIANADQRFIHCRHLTIPPNSLYQWFGSDIEFTQV